MLQDIPIEFNVNLLQNAPNPNGVLSSRAVGEPPLAMACAFLFSVGNAINSHLADFKFNHSVVLSSPATVDKIQAAASLSIQQYTLN